MKTNLSKNRGMLLELLISNTILFYRENNLAIFHKKEIPIKIIHKNKNKIDGILMSKSTVDYYGIYNGQFVCFEAKSTDNDYLPTNNIKLHQHKYLLDVIDHKGIAFYIILFKNINKGFILLPKKIDLTKTKITFEQIKKTGIELEIVYPGIIDFLKLIID